MVAGDVSADEETSRRVCDHDITIGSMLKEPLWDRKLRLVLGILKKANLKGGRRGSDRLG